jgi:hypothetical protein
VAVEDGHMPPKIYMLVSEAFALTSVEKLNPPARKSAPGRSADVISPAVLVVSCAQVPLPIVLIFEGVNLHNVELVFVEQVPLYTEISPIEEMEGIKAFVSLVVKGRSGVIISRDRLERLRVDDILSDTN